MAQELNNGQSINAMSMLGKMKMVHELSFAQKIHSKILAVYIPLCIGALLMSSVWANIQGKNTAYDDPDDNWRACLTLADYTYIPLNATLAPAFNQIAAVKANLTTCIIGEINFDYNDNNTDGCPLGCVFDLQGECFANSATTVPVIPNVALPTGHLLASMSYLGIQAVIFSSMGHAVLHRALRHPSWLQASLGMLVWFIFAMMTYYTVNPMFPVPTQTGSTLLVMLSYGASYTKWNNLNFGQNECQYAFNYYWLYMGILLGIVGTLFAALILGLYAEHIRYRSPSKAHYPKLKNTEMPCILGIIAVFFYILLAASKFSASENALESINDFTTTLAEAGLERLPFWFNQIYYPFAQPTLDIGTILYICSFMSILRGYTTQSISAFRLAFISSFVYTMASYPGLVGGTEFYVHENFSEWNDCYTYFLGANTGQFGYPSEGQAQVYCETFRTSLAASYGLIVVMHLVTFTCWYTVHTNQDRQSEHHPELDFSEDATNAARDAVMASRNSEAAAADGRGRDSLLK